jgi:hypothetical protein
VISLAQRIRAKAYQVQDYACIPISSFGISITTSLFLHEEVVREEETEETEETEEQEEEQEENNDEDIENNDSEINAPAEPLESQSE